MIKRAERIVPGDVLTPPSYDKCRTGWRVVSTGRFPGFGFDWITLFVERDGNTQSFEYLAHEDLSIQEEGS